MSCPGCGPDGRCVGDCSKCCYHGVQLKHEFVEIPVTRKARVTLVGIYGSPAMSILRDGDLVALRPWASAPFRYGTARIHTGWTLRDLQSSGIPTAAVSDLVYRVEPE